MSRDNRSHSNGERTVDSRKGTVLWAFNTFRSSILSKLIVDLLLIEKAFTDEECKIIRELLFVFLAQARRLPEGGFQKDRFIQEIEDFERIYVDWNDIQGEDEFAARKRKELLKKLQGRRYRITQLIRRQQKEFYNCLDRELIIKVYEQVRQAVVKRPTIFRQMARAYYAYAKNASELEA